MDELFFRSFQLSHGFKSVVSAADVVYSLTALLEMTEYEGTTQADNFWTAVTALYVFRSSLIVVRRLDGCLVNHEASSE